MTLTVVDLEQWAADLVGRVPFCDKGRDRAGLDCYGVVFLAHRELFGIELPPLTDRYVKANDTGSVGALMLDEIRSGRWLKLPPGTERPGDVILVRVDGGPTHVGFVLPQRRFLNADGEFGVCCGEYGGAHWRQRVLGFYRAAARGGG